MEGNWRSVSEQWQAFTASLRQFPVCSSPKPAISKFRFRQHHFVRGVHNGCTATNPPSLFVPFQAEYEELKALALEHGKPEEAADVQLWDVPFWAERLRESRYQLKEVRRS